MIAIDTSALIAIALREPEADRFASVMAEAPAILIGTPTLFEARMVLTGKIGADAALEMLPLLLPDDAHVIAFEAEHLRAATLAFARYGKGLHPASLNFGDCMSYAVASIARCPLLYKGDDFARTDIEKAV